MMAPGQVQFEREDQFQKSSRIYTPPELDIAASSKVVNRTHRVVRQRAKLMRDRRSYTRSLMVPLLICSALLLITVLAVWSGVYQESGAADAVQDLSATLSATDNDELIVMLFWFVPVTLAVLGAVWFTRFRNGPESETVR
jgi:hypothetical protein